MTKMSISKPGTVLVDGENVTIDGFHYKKNGDVPTYNRAADLAIDWAIAVLQAHKARNNPTIYINDDKE